VQDELTLKELILVIQEYFVYFLRNWYWLLLGALLLGGIFFYNAYTAPVNYDAPLTFMMNNEKGASAGAGAILGSLGLGGGGEGGDATYKLLELAKSRKVLSKVLFDSTSINGKTQLIADHIIDIYDYDEAWEANKSLKEFRFGDRGLTVGDESGNRVLKALHGLLVNEKDGLVSLEVDESSGVFSLEASSLDPELSIALVDHLFRELSEYFVATSISAQQETLRQLRIREDSVRIELSEAEVCLARFQDRSSQILLRQKAVKVQELNREVLILSAMYGEIVKNKETATFLLANEKPAFDLIDEPLLPLHDQAKNWKVELVTGGGVGVILCGIVLFIKKLVKDALDG
jgi:uncharacterized protein involved in exopolysaccharide biosynthesis